jgi:hypothetical protein
LHGQDLPRHIQVQRGQKPPQRALRRQLGDLQDARQQRIAGQEAQLIQALKSHIETQHDPQHKLVQAHHAGDPPDRDCGFHQRLEGHASRSRRIGTSNGEFRSPARKPAVEAKNGGFQSLESAVSLQLSGR